MLIALAVVALTGSALVAAPALANTAPSCLDLGPLSGSAGQPIPLQASCSDPDGPSALTYSLATGPTAGSVGGNPNTGAATYTAYLGFSGTDTFTYRAFDGADYSNAATVTLNITGPSTTNQLPSCPDTNSFVPAGGSVDISGNCRDPENDPISYGCCNPGVTGGSLQFLSASSVRYTPNAGTLSDAFGYSATDNQHPFTSVPAHVQLTVVSPGAGTFDTAPEASLEDPYVASLTTTQPGPVTIDTRPVTTTPPTGFFLLNQEFDISAPPALDAANPLRLVFTIDQSSAPGGVVTVFRNGVPLADCVDQSGAANPDPCVEDALTDANGDLRITALSTHASVWRFGVPSDVTPPAITLTSPAAGASFLLGSSATASYSCLDETGGSGLASCTGNVPSGSSLSTTTVGSKTFTVAASDNAGNHASTTHAYSVIYDFGGFFAPIDNRPVLNGVKAGQAVPVKFTLRGNRGLGVLAAGYPKSETIACGSDPDVDGVESSATAGASGLSYDPGSGQYTYVWKTEKSWAKSCRQLVVKLDDGTAHRADFSFK